MRCLGLFGALQRGAAIDGIPWKSWITPQKPDPPPSPGTPVPGEGGGSGFWGVIQDFQGNPWIAAPLCSAPKTGAPKATGSSNRHLKQALFGGRLFEDPVWGRYKGVLQSMEFYGIPWNSRGIPNPLLPLSKNTRIPGIWGSGAKNHGKVASPTGLLQSHRFR